MKSTMLTGLAAILLLAISCKKESVPITDMSSAPALTTDITEAVNYPSVNIQGQRWMTTNLSVTRYRNGDRIPQVKDGTKWASLTTGAWCWYNNDSATGAAYGRLYNWYAVNDPRGLAPAGWHIPSDAEWDTLSTHLGGYLVAGGKLKDTGTIESGTGLWHFPNKGATNKTRFTGLPGGGRYYDNEGFFGIGGHGYWWSSTERSTSNAWERYLCYCSHYIYRLGDDKHYGFSVRCLRD